jgi:hypothetical protein
LKLPVGLFITALIIYPEGVLVKSRAYVVEGFGEDAPPRDPPILAGRGHECGRDPPKT